MTKRYVGDDSDLRVRKTKRAIRAATLGLLAEHPEERPSVKEITARAEVNKSTFYYHYESVNDLLDQMEQELFDAVMRDAVESADLLATDPESFLERFADFAYAAPVRALEGAGQVQVSLLRELLASAGGEGLANPCALEVLLLGLWGFSRRSSEEEFRDAISELGRFIRAGYGAA